MHETPSLKSTCPFWDIASPTSRIAGDFQRFPSEQRLPRDSCTREGTLLSRHSESPSEGTAMFTRPENFSRLRAVHTLLKLSWYSTRDVAHFSQIRSSYWTENIAEYPPFHEKEEVENFCTFSGIWNSNNRSNKHNFIGAEVQKQNHLRRT